MTFPQSVFGAIFLKMIYWISLSSEIKGGAVNYGLASILELGFVVQGHTHAPECIDT